MGCEKEGVRTVRVSFVCVRAESSDRESFRPGAEMGRSSQIRRPIYSILSVVYKRLLFAPSVRRLVALLARLLLLLDEAL